MKLSISAYGKSKEVEFTDKKVNIFTGANNSGKTSLLSNIFYALPSDTPAVYHHCSSKDIKSPNRGRDVQAIKRAVNIASQDLKVQCFWDNYHDMIDSNEVLSSGQRAYLDILHSAVRLSGWYGPVLILDEPERNLHIDLQEHLLINLITINPDLTLYVATHSPALVMNGWNACYMDMEEIYID